jgi:predicted aspartyl protease
MSRRLPALLVAAVLAGCADDMAAGGTCQVVHAGDVAVERRNNLIMAPATINATPVRMVVDTGAETSAVTGEMISRLGLLGDPNNSSLMSGVGGQGLAQADALVNHLAFGPYDSGATHLAVVDLRFGNVGDPPLGGLIGADVLSNYDLDLDIPRKRLALYKVRHCAGNFLPWTMPYDAVPLHVTWEDTLTLPVTVDGNRFTALLDSGSTGTVLDSAAAERSGITAAELAREEAGEGVGAAGVNFQEVRHQFRELQVGPVTRHDVSLSVLDRTLRGSDMLLGLDFLASRHVWISYHTHQLFIARPAP